MLECVMRKLECFLTSDACKPKVPKRFTMKAQKSNLILTLLSPNNKTNSGQKKVSKSSPKPRGCPPILTILQSSPEELVKRRSAGNLTQTHTHFYFYFLRFKCAIKKTLILSPLHDSVWVLLSLGFCVHHQGDVSINQREGEELDTFNVLINTGALFGTAGEK